MVYSGKHCFQNNANTFRKTIRKAREFCTIDPDVSQFVSQECQWDSLSKSDVTSQRRSHVDRPSFISIWLLDNNHLTCERAICKNRPSMTSHFKVHRASGTDEGDKQETKKRHRWKILFAMSVEKYVTYFLISNVTAGLMSDNNKLR